MSEYQAPTNEYQTAKTEGPVEAETTDASIEELIHVWDSSLKSSGKKVWNIKDMRGNRTARYNVFADQLGGELSKEEVRQLVGEGQVARTGQGEKGEFEFTLAWADIANTPRVIRGQQKGVNHWINTKAVFDNISEDRHFGYNTKNQNGDIVQFPKTVSADNKQVSLSPVHVARLASGKPIIVDGVSVRMNGFTSKEKYGKVYNKVKLLSMTASKSTKEQAGQIKRLNTKALEGLLSADNNQSQAENIASTTKVSQ